MEINDAFISYLRKKMISKEPSDDELISMLDKRILELNAHQERVKLFKEIENLRKDSIIDAHYKGKIQDFFNYAKFKQEDEKDTTEKKKDWSELFIDLDGAYIKDVSKADFNEIMNYKRFPNGKGKGTWIGSKADAVRFSDNFHFTLPVFNECLLQKDGKKIDGHDRPKTAPKKVFKDLLIRHKQQ